MPFGFLPKREPHILYVLEVESHGRKSRVEKRYSDFIALDKILGVNGRFALPPKRILSTYFVPSAWLDDALITERKDGLQLYINGILGDAKFRDQVALSDFLNGLTNASDIFEPEDAVPSTLGRNAALKLSGQFQPVDEEDTGELEGDSVVQAEAVTLACTYYPDWVEDVYPPESIYFGKHDIIFFAFATPNSSSTLSWSNGSASQSLLKRLVTAANNSGKGTKIVLSVGGWGGSYWFSQAVSSLTNRGKFSDAIVSAVNTYGLAGVDIDWEYPNSEGAGNIYSSSDSAHLLNFLQTLRNKLGSSKIISAAVPHLPWLGSNGQPLTDVSAYAALMTYVNIMNYDVWGASSTPGPNAPYGNLCGTSQQPTANMRAAITQWTNAGFPASKLLLGLPLYGYVSNSKKTVLTGSFAPEVNEDSSNYLVKPQLDDSGRTTWLNGAHPRAKDGDVRVMADLRSYYGQQIAFKDILKSGALQRNADNTYSAGGGFTYAWDNCSNTPFLYRTDQSTVVTFDDPQSLALKAQYAQSKGLAGVFTWSVEEDDGKILIDAIRTAIGRPPPSAS
ncbi:glycoside hydrolase [Flagelloscypha sp. PMI_526]|nr:glycoside hydrolase [Flagelloscypha sp. PMI_526]